MKLSLLAATAICAALTTAAPAPGSYHMPHSGLKPSAHEQTRGPANTSPPSTPPPANTIPPNAPPPQRQTKTRPAQVDPTPQNTWKPQATKSWARKYRHRRASEDLEDLEDIDEDEEYLEERALLPTISFSVPFHHGGVKYSTKPSIPVPTVTKGVKPPVWGQKETHPTERVEARAWSKAPPISSVAPPASKVTQPPSSADAKKGPKKLPHTNTDSEIHGTAAHNPPKHTSKPKFVDREEDENEEDLEARNAMGPIGVIPSFSGPHNHRKPTTISTLSVSIPHLQHTGKGKIARREVKPTSHSAYPMPSVLPTVPTPPVRHSSIKPSCTESSKFSKQSYATTMQTKIKPTHHSHATSHASHVVTKPTSFPTSSATKPSTILPKPTYAYGKREPIFFSQLMHTPTRVFVPVQHTTGPVRTPKVGARDVAEFEEDESLVEETTGDEEEVELEERDIEVENFSADFEESEFEERDFGAEETEVAEEEMEEEQFVERDIQLEAVDEDDLVKRDLDTEETEITEEEMEDEQFVERDVESETDVFEDEEGLEEEGEE
ncbi:hypothetical protein B0J14DRAFT_683986 [Halenospora varia]|nr:hypothetical protein B0J14DRAFT_683986 [Halenospora varia]